MAGVCAAVVPHDYIALLGKDIHHLAFALVAPL
jgi:hypothetical protein